MKCDYFGVCGSCNLGHLTYEEQLEHKLVQEVSRFAPLYKGGIDIIRSEDGAFRNRAEFKIWKTYDEQNNFTLHYAMNSIQKEVLLISSCSIVSATIANTMPKLIELLNTNELLHKKLFSVEFLSSTSNDLLITLIYHKKLDELWKDSAFLIQNELKVKIIGRSRKQKIILTNDFIEESLLINKELYKFNYFENGFTQPNQKVNIQMIEWTINNMAKGNDLCELYCGGGNFTISLSKFFDNVLATEISKTSIKSAKINCELNAIKNIKFIRMSSEEFVEALEEKREFRRLKQEDINLKKYNFGTIFIDPPRAGLDNTTRILVTSFKQIIYISCNPVTLYRDLKVLLVTHKINNFAIFDQFAFSNHIEIGVILQKK